MIYEKIKNTLLNFGLDSQAITPDASFINDLGLDSLDFAEMVMEMENIFNIPIPTDLEDQNYETVDDLVKLIESQLV